MVFITEKGVLAYKSQVETGTSKSGNIWQKQTIVVSMENVNAPYDKVALSVFGDKVNDSERCRVGDKVEITYSIQEAAPAAFPQDNEPQGDLPF